MSWLSTALFGHRGETAHTTTGKRSPEAGASAEWTDEPVPDGPFNRRVEINVQIADRPEEIALAKRLFTDRGWRFRSGEGGDGVEQEQGFVPCLVEVRLDGAKFGSRAGAVEQLRSVAAHRLTLEIRDARVISPPAQQPTRTTTWHVYRKPMWGSSGRGFKGKLASLWVHFGRADIQQTIVLSGSSTDKDAAREALALRTSGQSGFDIQAHDVRLSIGPRATNTNRHLTWWQKWGSAAARGLLMLGLMAYGGLFQHFTGLWTALGAFPLLATAWFVGEWITGNAHRPRIVRLAAGAVIVGAPVLLGYLWEAKEAAGAPSFVPSIAIGGGAWLIIRGCWFALRNSWVSRHLLAVLSSIVLPLAVAIPAFGYFLQFGYLETFGIPTSAGTTEVFWQYAIALKPTGICLLFVAIFAAIAGWLRHYHWIAFSRNWAMIMVLLLALLYTLVVLTTGMSRVTAAAETTARDAMNGKQPNPYFGIKGTLMCVTPVSGKVPVYNGPLPKGHPVLIFGTSNGRMWLWDPERAKHPDGPKPTMHVQLFKVSTSIPNGNGRTCTES